MNPVLAATAKATLHSSRRPSERHVPTTVWNCISTELIIDPDGQKGPRAKADLVVSEVLDTGLIGEACLHSMRDASRQPLAPRAGRRPTLSLRRSCVARREANARALRGSCVVRREAVSRRGGGQ